MDRDSFERYILDNYEAQADCPWLAYPGNRVFRHCSNQKWFALVMDVPKAKLGLPDEDLLTVVNLKCDPILIGSLLQECGFFPGYHMSKKTWITAALDGSVPDETLKMLLDISYRATAPKMLRKKLPRSGGNEE